MFAQRVRGRRRVLQAVQQGRRRGGVHVREVGQQVVVAIDLGYARIEVGENLVTVDDRLTKRLAEAAKVLARWR
ncbi:hypothetical protein ACVWWN_004596 [Mycobacterium sp. URHB0021]